VRKGRGDARRWAAGPPGDEAAAEAAYAAAVNDLTAFKRQSSVYGLYGRKFKTVMVGGEGWGKHGALNGEAEAAGGPPRVVRLVEVRHDLAGGRSEPSDTPPRPPPPQELDHAAAARGGGGGGKAGGSS
jgi:hypothetical protein